MPHDIIVIIIIITISAGGADAPKMVIEPTAVPAETFNHQKVVDIVAPSSTLIMYVYVYVYVYIYIYIYVYTYRLFTDSDTPFAGAAQVSVSRRKGVGPSCQEDLHVNASFALACFRISAPAKRILRPRGT